MADQTDNKENRLYSKTVRINADPVQVWEALSNPELMGEWMSDTEIRISTDWTVGSPVRIRVQADSYKAGFTNTGVVLKFEPGRLLEYSHLSSLSGLPDQLGNYTILRFVLVPAAGCTELTLTLLNFPTESIFKHMEFYWNVTLEIFRKYVERLKYDRVDGGTS